MRYLLALPMLALSFVPLVAEAQFGGPIIPEACTCEGLAPAYGCVLQTIQNIIQFGISIAFVFATLALIYAGFTWMTSGASAEKRSQGKTLLLNVAVGIAVMLSAWLIVDFVMKTLYAEPTEFGPWNSILSGSGESGNLCLQKTDPGTLASGSIDPVTNPIGADGSRAGGGSTGRTSGTASLGSGCSVTGGTCVALAPEVSCEASGCRVDEGLKNALASIPQSIGSVRWAVTEGYPASRRHQAACHSNGTCVDVGLRPRSYTVQNIVAFHNAARAAGLSAVFETKDCSFARQVREGGAQAICLNEITAPHFSVYAR